MDYVTEYGYSEDWFGDWLGTAPASTAYMNSVYQIYTTQLMGKMADVIGADEKVLKYEEKYRVLKQDFLKKYVDETGNVLSASADGVKESFHGYPFIDNAQTALLWALKCELYDTENQRDAMIKNLILNVKNVNRSIRENAEENTLSVGFLGVNVILPVLTDIGAADVAYDLLLQDAMPSWLYSVKNGSTTIWERWNSYSIEDSFGDSGMNSFNHYSYGACLEWMYQFMCGIRMDEKEPGFKHVLLTPIIDKDGEINAARGEYISLYGKIISDWKSKDGKINLYYVEIPANTSATLLLPITEEQLSDLKTSAGISYVEMTEYCGISVAKFALESGAYNFAITEDSITVCVPEGYIIKKYVIPYMQKIFTSEDL